MWGDDRHAFISCFGGDPRAAQAIFYRLPKGRKTVELAAGIASAYKALAQKIRQQIMNAG
jgi:hypothetical protein